MASARSSLSSSTTKSWSGGDPDHFTFTLADEALVTIDVFRLRLGSEDDTLDTVAVSLTSPAGNYFFSGQHAGDPAVALRRLSGTYDLALNLAGGGDHLLALTAEPIPGIAESEPNDSFPTAEPLPEDVLVTGDASSGDDWFSFSGQAGDRVEFELHDRSVFLGGTQLDLTLVEPDGTTTHALGQMSALNRYGAILAESGVYALHLSGDSDYHLRRLPPVPAAIESEPNDTVPTASVAPAGRAAGCIETAGDVDVFALDVEASRLHRLRVYGRDGARGGFVEERYGSQLNGRVQVLDSRGRVLAEATSDGSSMSPLVHAQGLIEDRVWFDLAFVAPDDGPCYVRIDDRTGARYDYAFELE